MSTNSSMFTGKPKNNRIFSRFLDGSTECETLVKLNLTQDLAFKDLKKLKQRRKVILNNQKSIKPHKNIILETRRRLTSNIKKRSRLQGFQEKGTKYTTMIM